MNNFFFDDENLSFRKAFISENEIEHNYINTIKKTLMKFESSDRHSRRLFEERNAEQSVGNLSKKNVKKGQHGQKRYTHSLKEHENVKKPKRHLYQQKTCKYANGEPAH